MARDYGKVSPRFWTGDTGKKLRTDPDAQRVAFYLMTCGHANMIGVYHLPLLYIAHEVGMTIEGASKALARLSEEAFCTYDAASEWVFVHNFAAEQVGEALAATDKRVKGIERELARVPIAALFLAFHAKYADGYHLQGPTKSKVLRSPLQAPTKPEAEAGAGTEKITTADAVVVPGKQPPGTNVRQLPAVPVCPHEDIIAEYHRVLPELPQVRVWDDRRHGLLRSRWRESAERQTVAWWTGFFEYVRRCPFLLGQAEGRRDPFLADLEWLIRPQNFAKVIEGRYERAEGRA